MLRKRSSPPFVPLPGERIQFVTPPRTSVELKGVGITANETEPYKLSCTQGVAYITSNRIVYLPATASQQFESFTVEISRVVDSHLKAPWIGPNCWIANIERSRSSRSDIWNIPKQVVALHLSIIFNDGGAFDFYNNFRSAKERIVQAMEIRNMTSDQNTDAAHASVNPDPIHLEQLPAYEGPQNSTSPSNSDSVPFGTGQDVFTNRVGLRPDEPSATSRPHVESRLSAADASREQLAELPPSYAEVEQSSAAFTRENI